MFCFNCGAKVEGGARFCPECGVRLVEESVPASAPAPAETQSAGTPSAAEEKAAAKKRGFIFTNVRQLAQKFGVPAEDVSGALNDFISEKKHFGVFYELLDVEDYAFRCSSRRVSLTAQNDIVDFLDVLLDAHNAEVRRGEPESAYLFIIGGHDTIPMPKGPYFIRRHDCNDLDLDTDILYACPYGKDALESLKAAGVREGAHSVPGSLRVFNYDALFYVGRLPFTKDSIAEDFYGYLKRDIENGRGVRLRSAYAHSHPGNNAQVTILATDDLRKRGLFPKTSVKENDSYVQSVFLTPKYLWDDGSAQRVFNRQADIFYFLLHGGRGVGDCYYRGQYVKNGSTPKALSPQEMTSYVNPNIVVSGACYGARFIGYAKSDSMLTSSISKNTLLFLGASRISWTPVIENLDKNARQNPNTLYSSARMAYHFIKNLLDGRDAGEASLLSKRQFFRNRKASAYEYLIALEYNLFGDPTLGIDSCGQVISAGNACGDVSDGLRADTAIYGQTDLSVEHLPMDADARSVPMSLLEQVRSDVNANLVQIRKSVTKNLYEKYGVESRKLTDFCRVRYGNGQERLSFCYDLGEDSEIPNLMCVETDMHGNELSAVVSG